MGVAFFSVISPLAVRSSLPGFTVEPLAHLQIKQRMRKILPDVDGCLCIAFKSMGVLEDLCESLSDKKGGKKEREKRQNS